MYTIFLADLLTQLKHKFPNLTCRGESGDQWIGATAYADDLTLCASSPQQLNEMLTVVQQWAEDHSAKINYDNSSVITFNETTVGKIYYTTVEGTNWGAQARFPFRHVKSIQEVREVKYLGITVDDNLDMDHHCTPINKKIKMGTTKVIGCQKTFRRSGDFGYQQHITLVIWKALVLT